MRKPITQTDSNIAELRDIAELFRKQGKHETAEFLQNLAVRYEVISGAYRTASAALANDERRPLDIETIDKLAHEQHVWSDAGLVFDHRLFAREIEKAHFIYVPEWESARDYCS